VSFNTLPFMDTPLVSTDKTPSKILQTQDSFAMLYKKDDDFIHIRGSSLHPLQALVSLHTGVMFNALRDGRVTSPHADAFEIKVKCSCTDDGASLVAGERILAKELLGWIYVRTACCLHKNATAHTKPFLLVERAVCGVLNVGLSLQIGTSVFREELEEVIFTRAVVRYGAQCPVATRERRRFLTLFVRETTVPRANFRILHLDQLAKGRWSNHTEVEVFLPDGVELTSVVRRAFAKRLSFALVPIVPRIYPRSRWTGADLALGDVGLVQACHGLFRPAYRKWVQRTTGTSLIIGLDYVWFLFK
jgi:hypothetical protein